MDWVPQKREKIPNLANRTRLQLPIWGYIDLWLKWGSPGRELRPSMMQKQIHWCPPLRRETQASLMKTGRPSLRVKDKRGSAKGQKGSSAGYGILKERCRWSNFSIGDSPPHWFYLIFILGRWWSVILPLCSCYVGKSCSFVKVGQKRPRRWTSPCWDPQGQGQEKAQGWRTTTSWDPKVKGKRKRPPLKEAYFSTAVSAFGEYSTCIIKGKNKSCVFLYLV